VADVVLRRLFLLVKALGPIPEDAIGWDRFRAYVVIDEAQVLLTSSSDAKASLAKYASEARKFGIGLIIATQLRDNIPGNVWGNIDTRLWMLALDQTERQKNAKAAGIEETSLAALSVGEAFLAISSQPGQRPVHLKIDREGC
jgi:DNA helicase HerA-like ATPase